MRVLASRVRAAVEGLPAEDAALLLSVGLVLGVFPVWGLPTLLCLIAAFGLRLNLPALQLLNNLSSPLQLLLLLPLARVGAWLCGSAAIAGRPAPAQIGVAALHAVAGWACICVPAGVILYFSLICAVRGRYSPWSNGEGG